MPPPTPGCLDETQLRALADARLEGQPLAAARRHLEGCARCRDAVAERTHLADTLGSPLRPAAPAAEVIDERYVLEGHLGSGAMGTVYQAWDRQLGRKVALKFLQQAAGAEAVGRQRMLREAQALARVSHPNVVTVHDFGQHQSGVYLALELVRGQTLSTWQRGRPWREVLARYLQAGAGLAAAHRAGVVHRDFKPDNVVVSDDGRARVLDFGIARFDEPGPQAPLAPGPVTQPLVTGDGALVGTPAYMSPEQLLGHPADTRSDQFSFCVALAEGLTGARPFEGETFGALLDNVTRGRVTLAPGTRLPPRLVRCLRRGLEVDPARRWADLDALLGELELVVRPRRGPALVLGAAGATLLVALVGLGARRASLCTGAAAQADAAWNEEVKGAVGRAFIASGSPVAGPTLERVAGLAGAWRDNWVATASASCEATRVRGDQPDALFEARSRCLEQQLERFTATTLAWKAADRRTVVDAVKSLAQLPLPEQECSTAAVSRTGAAQPPEGPARAAVTRLRAEVATAAALVATGRPAEARARLERLGPELREAGWQPLLADAALALARAQVGESHLPEAEAAALDAVDAAERSDDAGRLVSARLLLSEIVAVRQWREADGPRLFRAAAVAIERAGQSPALQATLYEQRADFEANLGHAAEAHAAASAALRLREAAAGPDAPELAPSLVSLARVAFLNEALVPDWEARLERALALQRRALGERHPEVARTLRVRGMLRSRYGRGDGLPDVLAAVEMVSETLGDSPELCEVLVTQGVMLYDRHRLEEARQVMQRTLALEQRFYEADGPQVLHTMNNLAGVAEYLGEGSFEEQHARRTTLLALAEARFGRDSAKSAVFLINWCATGARAGRAAEVAPRCVGQAARTEALLPGGALGFWKRYLAFLQLELGEVAEARAVLAEAGALAAPRDRDFVESYQRMADLVEGKGASAARAWLARRAAAAAGEPAPQQLLGRELTAFLARVR